MQYFITLITPHVSISSNAIYTEAELVMNTKMQFLIVISFEEVVVILLLLLHIKKAPLYTDLRFKTHFAETQI